MLRLTLTIDADNHQDLHEAAKEALQAISNGYTDGAKMADHLAYIFVVEGRTEEKRAA